MNSNLSQFKKVNTRVYIGQYMLHYIPKMLYFANRHGCFKDLVLTANGYITAQDIKNGNQGDFVKILKKLNKKKGYDLLINLLDGQQTLPVYDLPRIVNAYQASILGPRFCTRLKKYLYKIWLLPFKEHLSFLALNINGFDELLVGRLNLSKKHVLQLSDDGLMHIAPIIMLFNKPPADIKIIVGKSVWKKIANNSSSRNSLLCRFILETGVRIAEQKRMWLVKAVDYSSTYLKLSRGQSNFELSVQTAILMNTWSHDYLKQNRELSKSYSYHRPKVLFNDTYLMCKQAGRKFNPKWSYTRMKNEHDDLSKTFRLHGYSKTNFKMNTDTRRNQIISFDTCEAKLVRYPLAVARLSGHFGNCLSSYIEKLKNPNLALYYLKSNKKESALMLYKTNGKWQVLQHEYKYNHPVDGDFKVYEKHVLDHLSTNPQEKTTRSNPYKLRS